MLGLAAAAARGALRRGALTGRSHSSAGWKEYLEMEEVGGDDDDEDVSILNALIRSESSHRIVAFRLGFHRVVASSRKLSEAGGEEA